MKSSQCTSELFYSQKLKQLLNTIRVHNNIVCSLQLIMTNPQQTHLKLPFIRMHAIIDKIFTKFYAIK